MASGSRLKAGSQRRIKHSSPSNRFFPPRVNPAAVCCRVFKIRMLSLIHIFLKQDVRELLDDERSLALTDLIIDSTPGNVGIPIGNQSSQVFALLYLNKLDHLMKECFRFRYYGRYMDDFYIIHESKDTLRAAWKAISEHLAERGLELNDKTQIFPLRNGLDFLGFHSYLTDTGKVVRKLRRASRELSLIHI